MATDVFAIAIDGAVCCARTTAATLALVAAAAPRAAVAGERSKRNCERGESCYFGDVVEIDERVVGGGRRGQWKKNEKKKHFCPSCSKSQQESVRVSKSQQGSLVETDVACRVGLKIVLLNSARECEVQR